MYIILHKSIFGTKLVVIENKRRLLVFLNWPTSQFSLLCIRAGMSAQERSAVEAQSDDPNSDVQILVVTFSTCTVGFNLHYLTYFFIFYFLFLMMSR